MDYNHVKIRKFGKLRALFVSRSCDIPLTFPIDDITTDPSTTDSSTVAPTSPVEDAITIDSSIADSRTVALTTSRRDTTGPSITASIATVNDGITIDPSITYKSTTASTTSTQEYSSSLGLTFSSPSQTGSQAANTESDGQQDYTDSRNVTATYHYNVSSFVHKPT